MIYYQSLSNPSGTARALGTIRLLVIAALAAYPAGCLLRVFGPDVFAVQLAGLLLILGALICAAILAGTRLQRIAGDAPVKLDEYERDLRGTALATAYGLFTGLILLGTIYLALAADFEWWRPSGYDQWSAVFWGIFLYASLLPTLVLALRLRPGDGFDADERA